MSFVSTICNCTGCREKRPRLPTMIQTTDETRDDPLPSDSEPKDDPPKRSIIDQLHRGYMACVECRGFDRVCTHCNGTGVVGR